MRNTMRTYAHTQLPGLVRALASAPLFHEDCGRIDFPPSRRQASKFLQGRGRVWESVRERRQRSETNTRDAMASS